MKKSLMATVAAVALIAGTGLASAEGAPKQEAPAQKTEAPTPAPAAQQKAPAEKIAPTDKGAQMKAPDAKADIKADSKVTTGQADQKPMAPKAAEQKSEPSKPQMKASETTKTDTKADSKSAAQPNTQQKAAETPKSDATAKSQTTGSAPASGSVSLTTEQKTKIRTTVLTSSAPRVTNINFSVNVGTVVPRTVKIVAVPTTLVEIHPAWRGYMYFVYNDEIIIVEPGTMKIIEVIVV